MTSSTVDAGFDTALPDHDGRQRRTTDDAVPVARRVLVLATMVGACVLLGAVVAVEVRAGFGVDPTRFAIVVGVFALGLGARVPVGVDRELPRLNWGELGLMTAFVLLPLAWVPVAAFIAALASYGSALLGSHVGHRARARLAIAAITVGAAVAVAIALAAGIDPQATLQIDLAHPTHGTVLLAGAIAYFLVTTLLASAWIATGGDGAVLRTWRRFVWAGVPLLVGAFLLGTAGVVVIGVNPWWLAVLVPMFWVLHRSYVSRARLIADKRVLVALADATPALHEMDERGVRTAALAGAHRLFSPDQVELVLHREPGQDLVIRVPEGPALGGTGPSRRLVVGGVELGELRLRFRRPVELTAAESDALQTYGDAVASALHDAATHRRLQAMTALSAYEAVHDPLTGLSNRFTLLARGNAELARLAADQAVALILFDIDKFRVFNEAMSHAAGDDVLRMLGRRLARARADGELLGCLGGDEFALLVTNVDDSGSTDPISQRAMAITTALAAPVAIGGVTLVTEVSAGVAVEAAGRSDMIELLRRADLALRQARREGARVCVYDPTTDPSSGDRLVVLADLRDALATTDQLVLYLQPIVDLHTGLPVGAEALVYWQHPRRGLLAPEEFFGTIEQSDMASGFSQYTVDMALALAAVWMEAGIDLPISVNLCARCTVNPEVPRLVAGMLATHGVAPDRLIIEITEGVMETELAVVDRVITGLRQVGVQISVDDFGTSSASLSFLTRIPVHEVKIDRSFVAAMGKSPQTDAIVRATVDLARRLGLRVVAQGVERSDQHDVLTRLGVSAGQGARFHPPLAAAAATELVRQLLDRAASRH